MPKDFHIAALGSSFAAGPGIQPIANESAGRSQANYAHQLATRIQASRPDLRVRLTDLTVSGATILNVLDERQHAGDGTTFTPQLQGLPPTADIVTFTCGGNDIGYIGGMMYDSDMASQGYAFDIEKPFVAAISQESLRKRMEKVADEVHRIAPNARLYLVQYLSIVGDGTSTSPNIPLRPHELKLYENVAQMLAQTNDQAAQGRSWVEVVPVAELSRGHAVGSHEPWVHGYRSATPYHPNLEGHTAVAKMLFERVSKQSK